MPNGIKRGRAMKINHTKALGQTIRKRRKALHGTQVYFSGMTGLSVTFISDVKWGKATAKTEKTIRQASLLGLDLSIEDWG